MTFRVEIRSNVGESRDFVNVKEVDKAIKRSLRNAAKRIKRALAAPTKGWSEPPVFHQRTGIEDGSAFASVYTEDEHYQWINDGVEAHDIFPRADNETQLLHYQENYERKTDWDTPLEATGGVGKWGEYIHPPWSPWTGIRARHFDDAVIEREGDDVLQQIADVIASAAAQRG